MKQIIFTFLTVVVFIPNNVFAQKTPREDGMYQWKDPANSSKRESIMFSPTTEEGNFVAILDEWGDIQKTAYTIINDEILFTLEGEEAGAKKYTCKLESGVLHVNIGQMNSSESLKRSYAFKDMPNPRTHRPEIVEVPDEEEIEEEIEIELDEEENYDMVVDEEEEVFTIVETQPEYIGGPNEFYNWLNLNLIYPNKAKKKGVEGRVYVEFIVNTDGSISDVRAVRGIGSGCDEEAVRLMQSCPNWTPGQQSGRTVRVKLVMPVLFKLS